MKICLVRAEYFHTDRHKDRHDEANGLLLEFCERA